MRASRRTFVGTLLGLIGLGAARAAERPRTVVGLSLKMRRVSNMDWWRDHLEPGVWPQGWWENDYFRMPLGRLQHQFGWGPAGRNELVSPKFQSSQQAHDWVRQLGGEVSACGTLAQIDRERLEQLGTRTA